MSYVVVCGNNGSTNHRLSCSEDGVLSVSDEVVEATLSNIEVSAGNIESDLEAIDATMTDGTQQTKIMGSETGAVDGNQRQIHVDGSGNVQTNVVNTINVAPANSANSHITDDPANSLAVGLKARQTIGTATTETFLKCSATGELQTSDTGTQSGLTAINNNALSIAATNVSLDNKATTTNGHLNNIVNQTSGLATESTLGDIDTKLDDRLPPALTTAGNLKISIEETSAGQDTAANSFAVTDARNKVTDTIFMTTELIGSNSFSSPVLDTGGASAVMLYGEQTAGTTVASSQLKLLGSNSSTGTFYHIGNLSTQTYISGRTLLNEGTPLLYGSHPRYIKVYNTGSSATITLRAVLSDFNEYQ